MVPVTLLQQVNFYQLVQVAMKVKRFEASSKERFQKKKFSRGISSSSGKRDRESPTQSGNNSAIRGRRQGPNVTPSAGQGEAPECPHCHRRHLGVCRLLTRGCFRCESTYHVMVNCPKELRDNRRMQGSGRGRSVAPPLTQDRGRGRGGRIQHRGRGGTMSETVHRLIPTATT